MWFSKWEQVLEESISEGKQWSKIKNEGIQEDNTIEEERCSYILGIPGITRKKTNKQIKPYYKMETI